MRRQVVAQSDSHADLFPENGPAFFTYPLPASYVEASQHQRWHVRLLAIGVSRSGWDEEALARDAPWFDIGRVFLSELSPRHVDADSGSCLASFRLDPRHRGGDGCGEDEEYIWREFKNAPWHETNEVPLQQLTFWLTDGRNDRLLPLLPDVARPTLIWLEMRNYAPHGPSFRVMCYSHSPSNLEHFGPLTNTLTSFECALRHAIMLPEWEVAVLSVSYPPDVASQSEVWFTLTKLQLQSADEAAKAAPQVYDTGAEHKFEFSMLNYPDTEAFLLDVTASLRASETMKDLVDFGYTAREGKPNEVAFKVSDSLGDDTVMRMDFSHGFIRAMGEVNMRGPVNVTAGGKCAFDGPCDLTRAVHSGTAILTTPIVRPSAVGKHDVRVLRVIPFAPQPGQTLWQPAVPVYQPLEGGAFNSIKFALLRADGKTEHTLVSRPEFLAASGGLGIELEFRARVPQSAYQGYDDLIGGSGL